MKDATRRKFDVLAAWSVDRLGRSLQDLVTFLAEIHAQGIDLYLHVQGLDTTTPAGKALFQMLGVFAEFERAIIQERIAAGLARARSKGSRLGRPPVAEPTMHRVLEGHAAGKSNRALAAELGISETTVRRVLARGAPPGTS